MFTVAQICTFLHIFGDMKMSIETRARVLIKESNVSYVELEKESGISKQVWSNALRNKQRLNSTHIEFLCKKFDDYAVWLTTGNIEHKSPKNAEIIAHAEKKAESFSLAISEMRYIESVIEVYNDKSKYNFENGFEKKVMPSIRRKIKEHEFKLIMKEEFTKMIDIDSNEKDEQIIAIDNYFREKAMELVSYITDKYGSDTSIQNCLSQLFTEHLIPNSKTNVFYDAD